MTAFKGMPITVHRSYYGLFGDGFSPNGMMSSVRADAVAGRMSVVSIGRGRGVTAWPDQIDTDRLSQFIPALKANSNIVIVPHHEPENDNDPGGHIGAVAGYRRFFTQMVQYLRPRLPAAARFAPVLMAFTNREKGPGFDEWVPDPSLWDVFGVDGYSHGDNQPLASTPLYTAGPWCKAKNKPYLITECGQWASANQSRYLTDLVQWIKSDPRNQGAMYWNSTGPQGGYALTDAALVTFRQLLNDPIFGANRVKPV